MKKLIITVLLLSACSKPQIKHAPIEPINHNIVNELKLMPVWYITREECDKNIDRCVYMDSSSAYNVLYNHIVFKMTTKKLIALDEMTRLKMIVHNENNE